MGSPVYCLGAAVTEFVFWQREPSLIGPNGYLRPAEGTLKRIIGQSLQQSEGDETTAVSGALLLSMALGCARPRRRRLPPTRSEYLMAAGRDAAHRCTRRVDVIWAADSSLAIVSSHEAASRLAHGHVTSARMDRGPRLAALLCSETATTARAAGVQVCHGR
jgi:hypothetical protein